MVETQLQVILIPIFSLGLLFSAIILLGNGYFVYRYKNFLAILFLNIPAFFYVVFEILFILALDRGAPGPAKWFYVLQELSVTGYLIVLPYFLYHFIRAETSFSRMLHKIHRYFFIAGTCFGLFFFFIAFFFPELFIDVSRAVYNPGNFSNFKSDLQGTLFLFREVLLGIYILYSLFSFLGEILSYRKNRFLIPYFSAFLLAAAAAAEELVQSVTGRYLDFFPETEYSRFTVGITLFSLIALFTLLRWFLFKARKGDIAREALEKRKQDLYSLAYFDELTGIPNRKSFFSRLRDICWEHTRDKEKRYAVLLFDLDNFKEINECFGYLSGDSLLNQIVKKARVLLGTEDTIYRVGGDEFAIILENIKDPEAVVAFAENLLNVFSTPFSIQNHTIFALTSIGVAFVPEHGTDALIVSRNANTALMTAKLDKNIYRFFSTDMEMKSLWQIKIVNGLREGLLKKQFSVVYQPIVDVDGTVVAAEALIRWNRSDFEEISPSEFIPMAESSGIILQLNNWLFMKVIDDIGTLQENGINIEISVNISTRHLRDSNLCSLINRLVFERQIPQSLISFEITESLLMQDIEENIHNLETLNRQGFKLSIDDFGTGYSSLNYLKHMPIHTLKIDKTFIDGVLEKNRDKALISAIIYLARKLDLQVIAEGVEKQAQFDFLKENNCKLFQGYLFSQPLPLDDFITYCKP